LPPAYSLLLLADAGAIGTEQVIGRLHTAIRIAYNLASETLSWKEVVPMLARILEYLDQNGVAYNHHAHPDAYTARDLASAEHVPPHEVAKTVVFVEDDGYGMAVLGADCAVDMYELRMLLGQPRLRLATEQELAKLFPECELGAMPPFGSLFHMPVYVDSRLAGEGMIEFNAGTHRDVVRLRFRDYESLVKPIVVNFARVIAA
jgi:Ala-tRNA(Pro) deacylase